MGNGWCLRDPGSLARPLVNFFISFRMTRGLLALLFQYIVFLGGFALVAWVYTTLLPTRSNETQPTRCTSRTGALVSFFV